MNFESKLCPLECTQGFSEIWPSDLVLDQTWPSFELDLDIMIISILNKISWTLIQNCALKSVHKVFLRFDLAT